MTIREHLVDDVSEWKKWWSMRWLIISALTGAASQAWPLMPSEWISVVPGWMKLALGMGSLASAGAAGVARVVKQKPKADGAVDAKGEGA